MNYISKLKNLFSQDRLNVSEHVKYAEITCNTEIEGLPNLDEIKAFINSIPIRDNVDVLLKDDGDEILRIDKELKVNEQDYNNFIQGAKLGEAIRVLITIKKSILDDCLSVYCYNSFLQDLCSLSLQNCLETFSLLLNDINHLRFIVFDHNCFFSTKTITFLSDEQNKTEYGFDRLQRLKKCIETSSFSESKHYSLIPDDFKFIVNLDNNPLTCIFDRLCTILSLTYISSIARIQDEKVEIQIMGQRNLAFNNSLENIKNNSELYKIYDWAYTEGNVIDKLIIVRNVLSLHCKYINIDDIDSLAFASMQSNYNLYLKNNVTQYLELKNKVAEYICDVVAKTGDYASIIFERFKQNLIAVLGFLFTAIIANIVSDQPLNNIFTKDVTTILEVVLAGSVIFLIFCVIEVNYQNKNIKNSYKQLKEHYKDVLTDDDVKEIFKNDSAFKKMQKEIKKRKTIAIYLWIAFILIAFIALEIRGEGFASSIIDWIKESFPQIVEYIKQQ